MHAARCRSMHVKSLWAGRQRTHRKNNTAARCCSARVEIKCKFMSRNGQECKCKDPNAGTEDCVDKWTPKRCNKKKNQGNCRKTAVARNCKATCEFCGCVDIWSEERCQQKKGKCNKNKVKEFCKMTCELC